VVCFRGAQRGFTTGGAGQDWSMGKVAFWQLASDMSEAIRARATDLERK